MAKPPDLDALIVPKGETSSHPTVLSEGAPKNYAHTLSLRLTAEAYRRLRRYVADHEEKTGLRITHQSLIETALSEYLTRHGG